MKKALSLSIRALAVAVLVMFVASCGDSKPKVDPFSFAPEQQKKLAAIMAAAKKEYKSKDNELQKSAVRAERRKAIMAWAAGRPKIKGWIGKLAQMGTTGDGNAYARVYCGDFQLSTTNNEVSASLGKVAGLPNTLIPQGSPLYKQLSQIKEGDYVVFDGLYLKSNQDQDYMAEQSLTEDGAMTEPDFLVRFLNIAKWTPPAKTAAAPSTKPAKTTSADGPPKDWDKMPIVYKEAGKDSFSANAFKFKGGGHRVMNFGEFVAQLLEGGKFKPIWNKGESDGDWTLVAGSENDLTGYAFQKVTTPKGADIVWLYGMSKGGKPAPAELCGQTVDRVFKKQYAALQAKEAEK